MPSKYRENPAEYTPYFHAGPYTSTNTEGLSKQLQIAYERLEDGVDRFTQMGSGWTIVQNHEIQLQIAEYQPFHGSSYIELHPSIKKKKAVVNIKNEDQQCFKWSILYMVALLKKCSPKCRKSLPMKL